MRDSRTSPAASVVASSTYDKSLRALGFLRSSLDLHHVGSSDCAGNWACFFLHVRPRRHLGQSSTRPARGRDSVVSLRLSSSTTRGPWLRRQYPREKLCFASCLAECSRNQRASLSSSFSGRT